MHTCTAVVEKDQDTGLPVGYVPGWPGTHSPSATLDELRENLNQVVEVLLGDGDGQGPTESEFQGTQMIEVA